MGPFEHDVTGNPHSALANRHPHSTPSTLQFASDRRRRPPSSRSLASPRAHGENSGGSGVRLRPPLYCIIAATAMVAFFAAEVFPRCKGKQDVLLCVVALAGAVFTGPILGFVLTTCADDADDETARVASPYTRCVENVGRSVILAVALLGLYAIYLAAVGCGGDVDGFLLAAYYGVMGVGVIVGHSVSWIMGCFLRRD